MDIPFGMKRTAIASSLLALLAAPVLADQHDTNTQTTTTNEQADPADKITVYGKTYRSTATKTSLAPEETPQGISVVDQDQLEHREVQSLNQALRYVPGVITETKGASVTMYDTFRIRGFELDKSYYDGLVLQNRTGWNLQPQIDPIAIQQVEVFKGPTSVLYGAMPPGGMVNMIAKTPKLEKSTKVDVATGSRNLQQASIDSTGQIGDSNFSYRFISLIRKQDSQVNDAKEERYLIAPSLNWQVSDRTLVNFNLYYQNDPAMGINSSLPASGMFISNPNGSTSPSTFAGDVNWNSFKRKMLMVGYKIDHQFNDNWSFLQNARYTDGTLHQRNTYNTGLSTTDNKTLSRNIYSTDESMTAFAIDNQFSGMVTTGDWQHNLLAGLDYQSMDGNSTYTEYTTSDADWNDFNIFDPDNNILNPSNLTPKSWAPQTHDIELDQIGTYFQDQVRYKKWVLLAGGRFDHYKSSDLSQSNGSSPTLDSADQSDFTYRVGALYNFDNGLAPYLSYATGFEPAAGRDANNNTFKPETSQQLELGLKYEAPDRSKQASMSLFHIVKNDTLVSDPDNVNKRLQVGEVTSQGLELQGRWYVTDNLDVAPSYTYTDMKVNKDAENATHSLEGTTPIYVPTHTAAIWSNYNVYEGALAGSRISTGARYVGTMQMNAENTDGKVPAYTVVDMSLGYDLGFLSESLSGASANLMINNLFNEEYYTCYNSSNCWYGAERSVELHVKYEL